LDIICANRTYDVSQVTVQLRNDRAKIKAVGRKKYFERTVDILNKVEVI